MIAFCKPNFRCQISKIKVTETGDCEISPDKYWIFCFVESGNEHDARALVQQDRYIHIHQILSCDFSQEWQETVKEDVERVFEAIEHNQRPEFPSTWRRIKEHLLTVFHAKCAYCEARITPTSFGDVEHYRPKAKVHEDHGHTGYYWLAYEPDNYLPSCQICNQAAKREHFPIAGTRATQQGDSLEDEQPLLINPYHDDYEEHLEFLHSEYPILDPPYPGVWLPGDVKGRTPKGMSTRAVLEIYREPIRTERLREMSAARLEIKDAYRKLGDNGDWDEFAREITRILSIDRPFRTAAYYEIREYLTSRRYWDVDVVKTALGILGFNAD